jgi:hypothetical protein
VRLRIATILVRHGEERYSGALAALDAFYQRQLPDVIRTTIVVDSALPRREVRLLDENVMLVGGDNGYWEFWGWDRGLAQLERLGGRFDLVHFVTSAFDMLYTDFISHFDEPLLSHASAAGVALGHIDHRNEPMRLFGRESDHWIRTSFFFLPQPAVRALHSMVSCEPGPNIFSSDPSRPFLEEAPLADELKDFVTSWLTGEGTGQGVTWHSRFDLDHDTFEYFKQKATTIFNEALLTVRLHELGFPVIDVSWLSVELVQASAAQVDWKLPWREQLAPRLAALPNPATPRASETK